MTDLIRFQDNWFCVFREGTDHVSPDGVIQIISSNNARDWSSVARLASDTADLRDPKLSVTPDNMLMLCGAGYQRQPDGDSWRQSMTWFSSNGSEWSKAHEVGDKSMWLWRVVWHQRIAYGVAYSTDGKEMVRLYKSSDGKTFETLVDDLFSRKRYGLGYPNETSLIFLDDDTCLCLLRRDCDTGSAQWGSARPPYTEWTWKDMGVRVGGPHMIRLPDGRMIAAVRLYDSTVRTALCWLDAETGRLKEAVALPSGGDCSYPGLVWHDDLLWVSYYSSHESRTSIYLATVNVS